MANQHLSTTLGFSLALTLLGTPLIWGGQTPMEKSIHAERVGDFTSAINYLEAARTTLEDDFYHQRLGWLLYLQGRFRESITAYRRSLSTHWNLDCLVGLLSNYASLGEGDMVFRIADEILKRAPENYFAHYYRGIIHQQRGELERAGEIFRRYPLDPFSLARLGEIAEKRGQVTAAANLFQQALTLSPSLPLALSGLNRVRLAENLARFARQPKNLPALRAGLEILSAEGRSREVVEWAEKGRRLFPGDTLILRLLGFHYFQIKNFPASLEAFHRWREAEPDSSAPLRGIIDCLVAMEKYREAIPCLELLASSFKENFELRRLYAFCLLKGGRYREHHQFLQRFPEDRVLQAGLGWNLLGQGKIYRARTAFSERLKFEATDADAKFGKDIADRSAQMRHGIFLTGIDYGDFQEDKTVVTWLSSFSPNRWWQFRGLFNRTETTPSSAFLEDGWDLGFTHSFRDKFNVSADYMWIENNDYLSHGGEIFSLRLGGQVHSHLSATLEVDHSDYTKVNVSQFSPALDWFPSRQWSFQSKGYFFKRSGPLAPVGGVERGWRQQVSYFWDPFLSLVGHFFIGDKRFAFESDSLYAVNSFDSYQRGYGLKLGYYCPTTFDFTLAFLNQNGESYFQPGQKFQANQWTAGVQYKY